MHTGKSAFGKRIVLGALALASTAGLSACQMWSGGAEERGVIASVYGNRSQSVVGDVYSRNSDAAEAPTFSGRW
ncbi:hotdog family protein [Cohnella fermenti]|uniref:Uncharacterized protein n=1 Tax=Cohnella fermenti TaxID=2565925 RepID=A0A4S4BHB7_9BACL|nr:hypothetical protein [Cohnella fermenti]THF73875.1 hypothetical protein E6C55_27605 [Cohnella fermenti]